MARVKKQSGTEAPDPIAGGPPAPREDPRQVSIEDVLENSRSLSSVIAEADKEAAIEQARQVHFDNANRAVEREIDPRYPAVVQRVFRPMEWTDVLDRYDAWLELGEKRTEEGFIRKAHEMGPRLVQDLFDCYAQVRLARETWELENDVVFGDMREQATKCLEVEKERKIRTKTITEKDVDQKCAAMFPDEWARQESKRLRMKLTEDRTKFAIENAQTRQRVLDSMMSKLR